MSSRLPTWIVLVGLLFTFQLGWWGVLLWQQGAAAQEAGFQTLNLKRRLATIDWESRIARGEEAGAAWQALAPSYAGIVLVPEEGLQIAGTALGQLDSELFSHRAMVLAEGAFFLVIMVMALGLILRTARRESYLALQQSNFLHAVTHEFRSPLQSLRLAVESLVRRPDPERAPRYAAGMLEDLSRLDSLVENVLTVGRVEARAFDARPRTIDLAAAVRRELEQLGKTGADPSDWLEVRLPDTLTADADPAALHTILVNLLENARKYGDGKKVVLSMDSENAYAVLRVRDQGQGFRPQDRAHLFERFWRAGDERVRTQSGAGLGLYVVSELARAQGASVDASSEGPGRGAEFLVRWPVSRSEP